MLGVMFVAFIVQIVFRYFFNFPDRLDLRADRRHVAVAGAVGRGLRACKESEEIRFDLLSGAAGRARAHRHGDRRRASRSWSCTACRCRRRSITSRFMKVEKSSYLKIRMDWLFSIYVVFLVAVIVRYLWLLWQLVRGKDPGAPDPTKASSGL